MENKKKAEKTREEIAEEARIKKLVAEINADFKSRREERLPLERQWELNINFYVGNQYSVISPRGEITEEDKDYYWQEREVFNHIMPIMESRLSKLSMVNPVLTVKPSGNDDKEMENAVQAERILSATFDKLDLKKKISDATAWSELTGTSFYKIIWDNDGGRQIGVTENGKLFEGDVKIMAVSPFEIFPDSLARDDVESCKSIIHAKVMDANEVFALYGKRVKDKPTEVFTLSGISGKNAVKAVKDGVLVIERYEKPSMDFPNGRLVTVGGNELLYEGDLPYLNGENEKRGYPFVKQTSTEIAGNFFGSSVVERLIPVQRAFNAVKNRKHEFMNRIANGVLAVEDGSVDTDELSEEGLSPGKVVIYRQGSAMPQFLSDKGLPDDFDKEEEKLLNEFVTVSGVSDVSSSAQNASVNSGTALEILVREDHERLLLTAETIRRAIVVIAKQVLRLYRQFITGVRVMRALDEDSRLKLYYVEKGVLVSDEVEIENENELLYTPQQRKDMLIKLLQSGILYGADGKLKATTKQKLLTLLGYKNLDDEGAMMKLHREKARGENAIVRKKGLSADETDDHELHVEEHTAYMLSEIEYLSENEKNNLIAHVKEHKNYLKENKQ